MTYLVENSVASVEHSQTVTDWEILNQINPKRLQRILVNFSEYSTEYIQFACELISMYHQVYRWELIQLRRQGYIGACLPPTSEQLQQIVEFLQKKDRFNDSQQILVELQSLAQKLRRG
jgi:hypothetical protein